MIRLWYATTNHGKLVSLQKHLQPHGFEILQKEVAIPEPRFDRVEDLANLKATLAYTEIKEPVVALDAGFYVYELNGFPRGYVNFALETVKLGGILKLAAGTNRRCEFRHAFAFHDGGADTPKIFVDTVRGMLTHEPRGKFQPSHWSVLTTIFIPDGQIKTLAEMDEGEGKTWRESRTDRTYADQFLDWYRVNRLTTHSGGSA